MVRDRSRKWDGMGRRARAAESSRLRGRREREQGKRTSKGRVRPAAKACRTTERLTEQRKDEDETTTTTQGDAYEKRSSRSSREGGSKQQRGGFPAASNLRAVIKVPGSGSGLERVGHGSAGTDRESN
jgi:hypothetical protein